MDSFIEAKTFDFFLLRKYQFLKKVTEAKTIFRTWIFYQEDTILQSKIQKKTIHKISHITISIVTS